jgi:SAM-dependent methyltransferase
VATINDTRGDEALTEGGEHCAPGSDAEMQAILQRLYRRRFSDSERREMASVWQVLVGSFFQKRLDRDGTVVDVGSGSCAFINAVKARRRIAVDANPDVLHHADPGIEVVISSDPVLGEIPAQTADCVFVSNVLEHLPDFVAVLRLLAAVRRILKPRGTVMILQPNFRLVPGEYFSFLDHRVILTDKSLIEAVEVTGFRVLERRVRFLPFTSKSALPKWSWLVRAYLAVPPAQWLFGGQTFVRAESVPYSELADH